MVIEFRDNIDPHFAVLVDNATGIQKALVLRSQS